MRCSTGHRGPINSGPDDAVAEAGRTQPSYLTLILALRLVQTLGGWSTDLARTLPQHSVSAWIGHLMKVSERHYLTITDDLSLGQRNRISGVRRLDAGRHGHCRPVGARLSRHRKVNCRLPDRLGGPSGDHCPGHDVSGH